MPELDRHALTRFMKDEALRLGFAFVGVTTPEPPPHVDVYQQWLAAGRHGEMAYLARERAVLRRRDPLQILPECRSILVVAAPYDPPAATGRPGRVAGYARGPDYHDVLIEKLQSLMAAAEARVGHAFAHRLYTDTGPILEREFAQRAGLGWIGKNTCLIHPRQGSYLLLAEALLGIELDPDAPFTADQCGTCTRCLEACPTQCILPDRTLDARRCISYLTIELKGSVPIELRPAVGDWLFGCDICQEVCPWNIRFAPPPDAGAPGREPVLNAQEILESDPGEVRPRWERTALRRARRSGLMRNAAIVAGNAQAAHLRPALERLVAQDPEPMVRSHAAWALARIGDARSRAALEEALSAEDDSAVRQEFEAALRDLEG